MSTELITSALDTALFHLDLKHRRRENALTDLAAFAHACGTVRDPDRLLGALLRHERVVASAIGRGVAIPHVRSIVVTTPHVVIGRAKKGIEWKAPGGQPVQLMIAVLVPHDHALEAFLELVEHASDATRLQRRRQRLMADDEKTVQAAWREGL